MAANINLKNCHIARQHGNINALYTWFNDERAMVLLHNQRPGAPWFVVCESAAYQYDDPHYLAKQARKAAEVLGLEYSTGAWMKIATIIIEGLPDLIRMPSAPEREMSRASFGTMKAFEDGVLLREEDIRIETGGADYA